MLELRDLGFSYPGAARPALQHLDLRLQAGQCLGLLGSNGAGKTTLLSLIAGLRQPQQGEIRWSGARCIGLIPQQAAFYDGLSVAENLALFADLYRLRGSPRRQRLERCIEACRLGELQPRRAGLLSGGQQRRLNFAIGLLQPASLYLFDEATAGVDAQSRRLLLDAVQQLTAEGCAAIYTSHHLDEVERVAQRIVLLDEGHIRLDLDKRELLGDQHELLLEWPEAPPPGLEQLFGELDLAFNALPAGYRLAQLDAAQLARLCQFIAAQPQPPSLLRFGRPSLEQLYLHLSGGRL
ncbi:ABC transporter ATP-binding protein [Geopseudomonas guangdongensis]|uniref:ABC-2 type transport system ATP-binding protein n=1 Tax=Geopseudomonas guangdongensis TaxID=1245526 RepID=A0A1H2G840_9GAMM|nr:ABC transporter ATP-binding protein [Pseudomonas guangdongensis]SDU15680.1 ABC-2 type transport system ATP-binding protein [Pseudomonas guangdongensis]